MPGQQSQLLHQMQGQGWTLLQQLQRQALQRLRLQLLCLLCQG
jgi:hypothetical protein